MINIIRDIQTKNIAWESWVGNYHQMQFQRLYCGWMTSRSTERLVGSELDQAGDFSEVPMELISPTPSSLQILLLIDTLSFLYLVHI